MREPNPEPELSLMRDPIQSGKFLFSQIIKSEKRPGSCCMSNSNSITVSQKGWTSSKNEFKRDFKSY